MFQVLILCNQTAACVCEWNYNFSFPLYFFLFLRKMGWETLLDKYIVVWATCYFALLNYFMVDISRGSIFIYLFCLLVQIHKKKIRTSTQIFLWFVTFTKYSLFLFEYKFYTFYAWVTFSLRFFFYFSQNDVACVGVSFVLIFFILLHALSFFY